MSEPIEPSWHKLVTVERYFDRAEASGGAPVFSAEADFDGLLDADVLKRAIDYVLPLHPLLNSRVEQGQGGLVWKKVETSNLFRHVVLSTLAAPSSGFSLLDPPAAIAIRSQPGLAIRLTTSTNGRSRLRFEYHHACTDGQGGARFYRDVTLAYAAIEAGTPTRCCVDKDALIRRGGFVTPQDEQPIGIREGLRNLWVTIKGRNHRIEPIDQNCDSQDHRLAEKELIAQIILAPQQASAIQTFLLRSQYTMNDVMLAATLMMLRKSSSSESNGDYFSILNPVDMRTWADRRSPASNRVGFAYIRRRAHEWANPVELLESVAEQLRYVRKRGSAGELMKGVEFIERFPFVLNRVERSGRFTPTATLTCLSNLQLGRRYGASLVKGRWMLAGAKIDRVACIAPLPPGVPLAVTVTDANGYIAITMRGARDRFDESRLKTFGESFCQSCKEICQEHSSA